LSSTTPRVLVVGDSVAGNLGSALQSTLRPPAAVVADISDAGCVFPDGVTSIDYQAADYVRPNPPSCTSLVSDAVRRFKPTTVLFITRVAGTAVMEYSGRHERPCDTTYRVRYQHALRRFATEMSRAGARVAITTYPYSPGDAVSRSARRQVDCVNDIHRALASEHRAVLVELARHVCDTAARCARETGGLAPRPDGVHFSPPQATAVATWIAGVLGLHGAAP
jgi:hypothetical protein